MENKKCRGVQNEDFLGGKIIHMDSSTISLQYSPQTGRNRSHDNIHHYCPVPYIHYLKLKETQTSQIASQFIRHSIIFFILKIPLSVGILSFRPVRGAQGEALPASRQLQKQPSRSCVVQALSPGRVQLGWSCVARASVPACRGAGQAASLC